MKNTLGYMCPQNQEMESYGEWRVTVYDVIFGELRFLDSHTT